MINIDLCENLHEISPEILYITILYLKDRDPETYTKLFDILATLGEIKNETKTTN